MLCYLNCQGLGCKQVFKNIWCLFSLTVDNSLESKAITPFSFSGERGFSFDRFFARVLLIGVLSGFDWCFVMV